MRLDRFWIGKYKNLKDVTIDFDEDNWITVMIGWNGTGKSNVLEALATLFRDLVMGERTPSFQYKLRYKIRDYWVHIDADPNRGRNKYIIHLKALKDAASDKTIQQRLPLSSDEPVREDLGKEIKLTKFLKAQEQYLPKYVFGYYSGTSSRMEEVFRDYLIQHDAKLRRGEDPGLRRLFYARPVHSQFVLLAFILQRDDAVSRLLNQQLGIEEEGSLDSVLFVLRQPPWDRTKNKEFFWGAKGVVRNFLDRMHSISLAPIKITRQVQVSLWNKKRLGFRYLFVKDLDALKSLVGEQAPREFFRDIESTYVSELIDEVRIRVKLRSVDGSVTFRELSEGEQQLLTVLGLLKFTSEEESLFLLDEPDTHLNPKWSVEYLTFLQEFVGETEEKRNSIHIVLTTHNPISIADLEKEQVQILKRDPNNLAISAQQPDVHPRGMGYSGLIMSDMFGLAAAIDNTTLELLERKRFLAGKKQNLTESERQELSRINAQLENYGFRYEVRDPVFAEYLRLRYQHTVQRKEEKLVDSGRETRMELAKRLIEKALQNVEDQR